MHSALKALTDELKRLKASGVKEVSVSEETLARLREAVHKRSSAPASATAAVAESAPPEKKPRENIRTIPAKASGEIPSKPTALDKPSAKAEPLAAATSTFPAPPRFVLPNGNKQDQWDALYRSVVDDPVCRARVRPGKKVVLGVGNLDAKIFFCGEAPGSEEEEQGEPFVGPAGQLLTKMIQGMGLSRADVYIGNIMNWRPELPLSADGAQVGNRPPNAEEMAYCLPYLKAQLEIVNPEVIVALGSTATQGLLGAGSFKTLGEIRSQWKLFADKPVMVTYHPSYILRNPINRSKRAIWEDLLKVMERVALPISDKQRAFFLDK